MWPRPLNSLQALQPNKSPLRRRPRNRGNFRLVRGDFRHVRALLRSRLPARLEVRCARTLQGINATPRMGHRSVPSAPGTVALRQALRCHCANHPAALSVLGTPQPSKRNSRRTTRRARRRPCPKAAPLEATPELEGAIPAQIVHDVGSASHDISATFTHVRTPSPLAYKREREAPCKGRTRRTHEQPTARTHSHIQGLGSSPPSPTLLVTPYYKQYETRCYAPLLDVRPNVALIFRISVGIVIISGEALSYQVYQKIFPVHHVAGMVRATAADIVNILTDTVHAYQTIFNHHMSFRHSMAKCSSGCVGGTVPASHGRRSIACSQRIARSRTIGRAHVLHRGAAICWAPGGFCFHTHPVLYITKGWASHTTSNFSSMGRLPWSSRLAWKKPGGLQLQLHVTPFALPGCGASAEQASGNLACEPPPPDIRTPRPCFVPAPPALMGLTALRSWPALKRCRQTPEPRLAHAHQLTAQRPAPAGEE
ncbi:hypothetical protein HU200_061289 [Digitaria exilis]|uniref:Uncharacterized protein n=1 Tax=Digitaria exilis TaxID=1010633 RepID=A0A835AHQ3_9POAL|nr:hypothetical protein HU200_061289 [Digitaria exilis]